MNEFHRAIKLFGKTFLDFSGTVSDKDSGKSLEREIVKRDKKYTELLENYLSITNYGTKIAALGLILNIIYCIIFLEVLYESIF